MSFQLSKTADNACIPSLILVVITFCVFFQLTNYDFVNFDDDLYVYENNVVKNGITLQGIKLAFTTIHVSNWHPITWLSHMLDCQLFGLNPGMHHFTGLLIHLINCVLLLVLLNRISGELWKSFFVSVLFAIHPLHVESVAWVSERKDVLSAMFWFLTIFAYFFYTQSNKSLWRYILSIFFFLMGVMTKPMIITLPFVLILIDYWPLNRFHSISLKNEFGNNVNLIIEKIPYLVISFIVGIVTIIAQKNAVAILDDISFSMRFSNAIVSYCKYLLNFIWPINLSVFYPYPVTISTWSIVCSVVIVISISLFACSKAVKCPYFFVGWFWYLGTLVPVIGIVQVGLQSRADRYTYIPLIGIFIVAVWGLSFLWEKYQFSKLSLLLLAQLSIALLAMCSYWQASYWKNSFTLFDHAAKVTKDNYVAYNNLGAHFGISDDESIGYFLKSIEIKSDYVMAYNNLSKAYFLDSKITKSIEFSEKALEVNPENPVAHYYLGLAFSRQENFLEAIKHFQIAIDTDESFIEAYINLGVTLAKMGRYDQAIRYFELALAKEPGNILARKYMNNAVEDLKRANSK